MSKSFKLTLKKTPSQPAIQPSNGVQPAGSVEQRARAPLPQAAAATPPIPTAAAGARPGAAGPAPRRFGLTLKGSKSSGTPQASAGTPAAARITLRGAGSSAGHATPAAATPAPQQAAVPATPSSAPSTGPRRLALKGQSSRPPAAAGTPATPAPAAAATPASAPRTAPPAVGSAAGGFATPRPAAVAATPARAASTTPAGGSAQASKPKTGLGIRLKGSSSTPASAGGPARMQSATPGSMPRPAATPGSATAAGGGSGPLKPRITLNKSRGSQNSMGLSQQHSMQSQHSLQHSVGHGPLQPVAQKQEAYRQEQQAAEQAAPAAAQHYDYYSGQGLQGYDSSQAGYGAMPSGSYMSHDYSGAAAAGGDPAAAAAGGMYGMSADYGAMGAHASTDPAAAAAGGMYGAEHDGMYGMHGGYDPAAAAATAVVDYSAHAYYQPQKQKGVKRGRAVASARPAAAPAAPAEPLGPRAKRPKPGQFRDTEEEDADEDFNPKAERARMARGGGGGGSGGIATTRVKSKGPSGARAASAWPAARPAPATRPGSNRAAAAQKAAHRAAQNAAQRMHPHAHMGAPQRAGGGHMSAVVPTHRPRQHMMPVGSGALASAPSGAPRSPVLGEDSALPSGADLAAAFNQSAAAQDLGAAVSIDLETAGSDAAVPVPVAAAPVAQRGGGGRGRHGGQQQRRSVETVLAELHQQVEYVEETHPPTRENLIKLLAAVDKRDKYRFFVKPVTEEQAPGYSGIIKNPMDLSVMKTKVEGGMYGSWNELMADIILMCANAKVYNHPNTKPHKEADVLFKYSMKYVKSFKQGKTALRGAVAMAVRNANADTAAGSGGAAGASGGGKESGADAKAAAAPSGPMTRNARRGGRRPREEDEAANKTNKRQRQPKFIPLSQNLDIGGSTVDGDSARESFKGRPKMYAALWGGLADGSSPEGVPFGGCDKPILRCVAGHVGSLPPDTYLKSLSRFVAGAGAAVEKLVLSLLGQDLGSKLIPIPGVSPAQQAGAHGAAHRPAHQQQQLAGARTGTQLPVQARAGAAPAAVQPGQQQSLAGILGAVGNLTPAQLHALQQNQLQQQLRQQQQGGQQQAGQQFVPGPGAMSMARAP